MLSSVQPGSESASDTVTACQSFGLVTVILPLTAQALSR